MKEVEELTELAESTELTELQDSDEFDDEWADAESDERYPWLSGEPSGFDPLEPLKNPVHQRILEREREKIASEAAYVSPNGTNYHYVSELKEEHLAELDFLRYDNMFVARPANSFLKLPDGAVPQVMLFGELWRQGQLTLLFADTGLGKSVLAVQIACALAGGSTIEPFEMHSAPQRVLYFDFELSHEQFAARYADDGGSPDTSTDDLFPLNFIRCAPREDWILPDDFADEHSFLIHSIIDTIRFSNARVIILDNLSWLTESAENSSSARRLMRMLQTLRRQLGLSILLIAHTPKVRSGLAVEMNQLQGSKMLANFADNIVGMGRSSVSNDLRYLKPLKLRTAASAFEKDTVPVMRLAKRGRMLGFTFVDVEPESHHLEGNLRGTTLNEALLRERKTRAVELANGGDTIREIAEKLGVGVSSVSRYLKENAVETAINAPPCAANADKTARRKKGKTGQEVQM